MNQYEDVKNEDGPADLILGVSEPQGGVDDHEDEGEDDAREKDENATELVNHKVAKTEGGHHHHRRVVLLQRFHLNLEIFQWMKSQRKKQEK